MKLTLLNEWFHAVFKVRMYAPSSPEIYMEILEHPPSLCKSVILTSKVNPGSD